QHRRRISSGAARKMLAESMPTRAETVVAAMAREIEDGAVVATGVASPLAILAIAVARATHAPNLRYLACVGALDPEITRLRLSSEALAYLDGRAGEVTIPALADPLPVTPAPSAEYVRASRTIDADGLRERLVG